MHEEQNFTNKTITNFDENDTFYMEKSQGDYTFTFRLKFKSFSKGIVTGEIVGRIQPNNLRSIWLLGDHYREGMDISGRISKCYTFENPRGCRWFKKGINGWACS